jgi:hypothetical protein
MPPIVHYLNGMTNMQEYFPGPSQNICYTRGYCQGLSRRPPVVVAPITPAAFGNGYGIQTSWRH